MILGVSEEVLGVLLVVPAVIGDLNLIWKHVS